MAKITKKSLQRMISEEASKVLAEWVADEPPPPYRGPAVSPPTNPGDSHQDQEALKQRIIQLYIQWYMYFIGTLQRDPSAMYVIKKEMYELLGIYRQKFDKTFNPMKDPEFVAWFERRYEKR